MLVDDLVALVVVVVGVRVEGLDVFPEQVPPAWAQDAEDFLEGSRGVLEVAHDHRGDDCVLTVGRYVAEVLANPFDIGKYKDDFNNES